MEQDGGQAAAGAHTVQGGAAASVDFAFYKTFWELQQAFSKPAAVSGDAWAPTMDRLQEVLEVFGSFEGTEAASVDEAGEGSPAQEVASTAEEMAEIAMEVEVEAELLSEVYFAKFLTSAKLINLQLRDVYFRRHVLVQVRMFLQTAAAQDQLLAAQRTKIDDMETRANSLMAATAPNGALFAATVRATLQREKHWADWKKAGCVAFDKAAVELSGQKRKAAAVGRSKRMQLTKLWNMGSNSLEDIAANAAKSGVPSLVDFL